MISRVLTILNSKSLISCIFIFLATFDIIIKKDTREKKCRPTTDGNLKIEGFEEVGSLRGLMIICIYLDLNR